MNKVQEEWQNMRIVYQMRYAKYCEKYKKSKNTDKECLGHLLECSYVLISVFGLTDRQINEIEMNYGLTNKDIE